MRIIVTVLLTFTLVPVSVAAQTVDGTVTAIVSSAAFKRAVTFLDGDHERFVRELVELAEIPAPPFNERTRAAAYLEMLRGVGLSDVETDAEGNVMGVRKGIRQGPVLAVLAHLDTVFPEWVIVKVRREGTKLYAPGVGDDSRALAVMLSLVRAMDAANLQTSSDILFVGSVGEEGEGDLRGAKYLMRQGKYKERITQFIALDGFASERIVNGATGSKRYRVTFRGPGGHSYLSFGLVNPGFAMANALAAFSRITVPDSPKTTFNVGVVGGGTSVNSIPSEMFMDIDMRSESPLELDTMEQTFLRIVQDAVDTENRIRSVAQGKLTADVKLIGNRPSGQTPSDSRLVQGAAAVVKSFGLTPSFAFGSTDSNIPIALSIPAITIGPQSSGRGGRAHSLDEWTDVDKESSVRAAQITLAMILKAASDQ